MSHPIYHQLFAIPFWACTFSFCSQWIPTHFLSLNSHIFSLWNFFLVLLDRFNSCVRTFLHVLSIVPLQFASYLSILFVVPCSLMQIWHHQKAQPWTTLNNQTKIQLQISRFHFQNDIIPSSYSLIWNSLASTLWIFSYHTPKKILKD